MKKRRMNSIKFKTMNFFLLRPIFELKKQNYIKIYEKKINSNLYINSNVFKLNKV